MYKRIIAAFLAVAMSAAFVSCGNNKGGDTGNGGSSSQTENETTQENVEIMNFTPPAEGDTIIEMNIKDYGTVKFRLFPEYADKGVENFIELAKSGYYDGLTFHRVIKDFMIQGGDPSGNGTGGESTWGGKFDGGTDPHLSHVAGALCYANSGSTATNGSQFYVVTGMPMTAEELDSYAQSGYNFSDNVKQAILKAGYGYPFLDGNYTVFGQVIDGLDVIFNVQHVETDGSDMPTTPVIMESVKVTEYHGEECRFFISDYDYEEPTLPPVENVDLVNFSDIQEGDTVACMKIKDYGDVMIRFFPEYADKGVENFVELAKSGYYDGLTFHRIIKDFMIQGGDPNGDGTGGESTWGGEFDGGTDPHAIHAAGAIAYANSGSTATDGSQFYIVTGEKYTDQEIADLEKYGYRLSDNAKEVYKNQGGTPFLDGSYTVFGQVFDGLDIVFRISEVETGDNDKPAEPVTIESVTIGEYDGRKVRWYMSDYDGNTASAESESETSAEAETEAETTENEAETEAAENETEAAETEAAETSAE